MLVNIIFRFLRLFTNISYWNFRQKLLAAQKDVEAPQQGQVEGLTKTQLKVLARIEKLGDDRAVKPQGRGAFFGVLVSAIGGLAFGFFAPATNIATNDQFNLLPQGVHPLVVYTSYFWFSLGFFITSFICNITFLYKPPLGLPKSSIWGWIKDNNSRIWAIGAGIICGWGNGLQFIGGQAAGYAAADCTQAYPLIGTIWGVLLFKEYVGTSYKVMGMLAFTLVLYAAAVALLAGSSGQRES